MNRTECLTFTNERGESVVFSTKSEYHVNDVSGLSDVVNTHFTTNGYGQHGDTYISTRIERRDIDISGCILSRKADVIAEKRRWLTHALNPMYTAILTYEGNGIKRIIACRADSSPVFGVKSVVQYFSIGITCLNPFWTDETETRTDIANWVGGIEFPLFIPQSGFEMGHRQPSRTVNVYNRGDVKTGMRIAIRATGTAANPQLMNIVTGEVFKLNAAMVAGDVITITTGYGNKMAVIKSGGVISDATRYITAESVFLQLETGDNLLQYSADENAANIDVAIYHNNCYLGV